MANFEENDRQYRKLWQQAKKGLQAYASITRNATRTRYNEPIDGPLSQPKSGQTRDEELNHDTSKDDNCMEYMIKVVSSEEKGEQMKQRRVRFEKNVRMN